MHVHVIYKVRYHGYVLCIHTYKTTFSADMEHVVPRKTRTGNRMKGIIIIGSIADSFVMQKQQRCILKCGNYSDHSAGI